MKEEEFYPEDQPLSEEDQELVEKVYNQLEIFSDQCKEFHDIAKECRKVVRMKDPKQDDNPKAKKKTLQLQTLKSTINNVVADQSMSIPEPRLLPETPEQEEVALDLQDMVRYVLFSLNNYEGVHEELAEDFYVTGTALTQIAWDEDMSFGNGDIGVLRWPIEAFLWDPMAERLQDSRAVMKVSWHPLSWFKDHYPEQGKYVHADEDNHSNIGMVDGQEEAKHASDEDRALLIEYWYRTYAASRKSYSINVAYVAGHALLSHHKNVYAHGMYPFVMTVHDRITGVPVGEGLVQELAPMMRYINRYAAYLDMNARMSSKGRVIMKRSCGIDKEEFANMENDIVEGDHIVQGEDWNWIQNAPFNNVISNQMLQFQTELKQDSGANQFTRGETTGGIVSGKAINSLIQAGGKVTQLRTNQLKTGFKEVVEQVLWLMSEFYDNDRTRMITGREGVRKAVKYDSSKFFGKRKKGSIEPPPYTVQIEISTKNPDRIEQQNRMFLDAYTMAAQAQQFFPLSSLFELLVIDGKDRLLPIIRANESYQQQMQQMQQQVMQMGQQMEGLQKENENLRSTASQMTNALAGIRASTGGGFTQMGDEEVPEEEAVAAAQNQLGGTAMM